MPANTSRKGAAGAFHTAAQLAERDWDASLTLGNAPRTDIVAQHAVTQRTIAVQCKASSGKQDFVLSLGCETPSPPGRDEWFVLINLLGPDERPNFYVMPRNVVSAYLYVGHRAWLKGVKRDGAPRRNTSMRNVELYAAAPYKERWDLMERSARDVPYWLADWVFDWAEHVGLPDGHPGVARPADDVDRPGAATWLPPLP